MNRSRPGNASVRSREVCEQCGFDSDRYDRADTISSQRIIPAVLAAAIEGLAPPQLSTRTDDTTWSIGEYLDHIREMAFGNRFAADTALRTPSSDLGDLPAEGPLGPVRDIDVPVALAALAREYEAMGDLLAGLDDEGWGHGVTIGGKVHTVGWFGRHVLHDGLHHLGDIGRIRHRLGFGASTETGRISGIHRSDGGVPKQPVQSAALSPSGLAGDHQADRRHHGRPVQAVCLWSADVIAGLRAEGHPIIAGAAGENITVEGVDWAELRPGARVAVGSVPLLITAHAIPCSKNAQWFSDRNFNRILHQEHPGSSRLYAIPLRSGAITVGDPVTIEP